LKESKAFALFHSQLIGEAKLRELRSEKKNKMSTKYTLRFKVHRSLGNRGQTFWPHRKLTEKQKLILQTIPKKKLSGYGQDILLKRILSALYGKLSATQMKYFWQKALSLSGKLSFWT
jgi:hypothetical protein